MYFKSSSTKYLQFELTVFGLVIHSKRFQQQPGPNSSRRNNVLMQLTLN